MLADATTIPLGVLVAALAMDWLSDPARASDVVVALLSIPGWIACFAMRRLYTARVVDRRVDEIRLLCFAALGGVVTMVAIAFACGVDVSRSWATAVYLSCVGVLLLQRMAARRVYQRMRANRQLVRRVAVIGTDPHAFALASAVEDSPSSGYLVVGLIGPGRTRHEHDLPILGPLERAAEILHTSACTGVLISLPSVDPHEVNKLTRDLTDDGYHVAISSGLRDIALSRMRPQELDGQALVYVEPTIRTGWRASAKRCFDIAVAGAGMIVTLPILIAAAIAIKIDDGGPVLFRQQRVGRNGQPFEMVKLRTMSVDAESRRAEVLALNEADGPLFKATNDPRITRVGRFLRATSIDELPQFWNVIVGEMSVVGPRPALPSEMSRWDAELHGRLRVLPGISGLWQVSGRSDADFGTYKRLDLHYVDNWSLWHDVSIVGRTVVAVFGRRGAR